MQADNFDITARLKQMLDSDKGWSQTVIRLMLGVVLFPHGAQKVFGWFGGSGFGGTMDYFTETMGLPVLAAFLVITIEFMGSLFLVAGLLTRATALSVIALFTGIILSSHIQYGFFMNWYGNQAGEGFEYHLLVLAMAAALAIAGGGKYAADTYMMKNLEPETAKPL